MANYTLSPLAEDDLAYIWDDTVEKWGEAQAERYTDALDARCAWLADRPHIGVSRDEVREGLRCFPEGEHFVFYRVTSDGIEIVGFPYQRQELQRHFSS